MCMTQTIQLAATNGDAFAERMVDMLNGAGLALMISIGHRTRLFDTMAAMPPSTSEQIAEAAGLNERYVREWLGAMVTGRIVEHDATIGTYALPASHAAFLTRAGSPNNIAATLQWISVLGEVESRIVECFEHGGGLSYGDYRRFHDVMAEESGQTTVAGLFEHILPLVEGVEQRLQQGIDVLDIGCGQGRAIIHMAERFPNSRFRGYDLCADAVAAGQAEIMRRGLSNIQIKQQDVARMDDAERYELVTAFDAIHDQRDPATVLGNIRRALKPDGVFLMQDIAGSSTLANNIDGPLAPFVYTISCMHCMSVSLGQGGAGLGAAWGEQTAERMLQDAGFTGTQKHRLEHDTLNAYFVSQR